MARARNIKPGFFKNYELADLGPISQLLFAGLWCLADREGRLEDKPRLIKAEVFPYYDCDVNGELTKLERLGFVNRYNENGIDLIEVVNFTKHQSPHKTEKASTLPAFDPETSSKSLSLLDNDALTVNPPLENGGNPPDSLIHRFSDSPIPDSPIPDSGFTDSLIPDSLQEQQTAPRKSAPHRKQLVKADDQAKQLSREIWNAYATAYLERYNTEPVRNAKVNGQISQIGKRLGVEAPAVAAFYVGHNNSWYVQICHGIDGLVKHAESLRTQWATNRQVTQSEANGADRTHGRMAGFDRLLIRDEHGKVI